MSAVSFPAPVGGVAFPSDFVPSIIFAVLYGALFPLVVYRLLNKRSRTILLLGSAAFAIERVVIFSLRAVQAHDEQKRLSRGLNGYMQITIGMGFINMGQDLVSFTRCLLVNATKGTTSNETNPRTPLDEDEPLSASFSNANASFSTAKPSLVSGNTPSPSVRRFLDTSEEQYPDRPRQRFWARRFTGFAGLSFLAAVVPGFIAGTDYSAGMDSQSEADYVFRLRYASCGVAVFLTSLLIAAAVWGKRNMPRIRRTPFIHLVTLTSLIFVVAFYRLVVMYHTTTALDATGPGTLNTPAQKTAFYVFHMLPEWIASVLLFGTNVREVFQTGPFGDYRSRDETPEQREKREKKEAAKAAAKRLQAAGEA